MLYVLKSRSSPRFLTDTFEAEFDVQPHSYPSLCSYFPYKQNGLVPSNLDSTSTIPIFVPTQGISTTEPISMRLLDTTTFELHSAAPEDFKAQGYAILSHRWVGEEITFRQIERYSHELRNVASQQKMSPQLDKIRGACRTARQLGLSWIWIDNCCINKESTTEEAESINSMFKWYRDAQVCITYLSDVGPGSTATNLAQSTDGGEVNYSVFQSLVSKKPSEWFSRGWTLQELLAPHDMRFFDMDWNYMGTKTSLAREIEAITGIEADYLTGSRNFRTACIATKMSWMADRTTTREEDIAYGMLGLFNVTMTPQYGEGLRAFMRLQHELLLSIPDESIFAWQMPDPNAGEKFGVVPSPGTSWSPDEWGMLSPSPDWFKTCRNFAIEGGVQIVRQSQAFQKVREGIQIPIAELDGAGTYQAIWMASSFTVIGALPAYFALKHHMKKKIMKGWMLPLNCWVRDEKGKMAAVSICMQSTSTENLGAKKADLQRLKRIQASTMFQTVKYAKKKTILGQGVALQPELTYMG
jgi:hypothetical protein